MCHVQETTSGINLSVYSSYFQVPIPLPLLYEICDWLLNCLDSWFLFNTFIESFSLTSAAFGSQMGLMLGASVLTTLELVDFIISKIFGSYTNRKSKLTSNAVDDDNHDFNADVSSRNWRHKLYGSSGVVPLPHWNERYFLNNYYFHLFTPLHVFTATKWNSSLSINALI